MEQEPKASIVMISQEFMNKMKFIVLQIKVFLNLLILEQEPFW